MNAVNLTIVGISYCEAYPQDTPRCESLTAGGVPATIDWEVNGTAIASFAATEELGLNFTLYQVDTGTRSVFRQILSTFKFIEPDETADWNVYRNEEYGYEIKYSPDLVTIFEEEDWVGFLNSYELRIVEEAQVGAASAISFSIIHEVPKDLRPWVDENSEKYTGSFKDPATALLVKNQLLETIEDVKVGTEDGLKFVPYPQEARTIYFLVLNKERGYLLEIEVSYKEVSDAILSTFKFI